MCLFVDEHRRPLSTVATPAATARATSHRLDHDPTIRKVQPLLPAPQGAARASAVGRCQRGGRPPKHQGTDRAVGFRTDIRRRSRRALRITHRRSGSTIPGKRPQPAPLLVPASLRPPEHSGTPRRFGTVLPGTDRSPYAEQPLCCPPRVGTGRRRPRNPQPRAEAGSRYAPGNRAPRCEHGGSPGPTTNSSAIWSPRAWIALASTAPTTMNQRGRGWWNTSSEPVRKSVANARF